MIKKLSSALLFGVILINGVMAQVAIKGKVTDLKGLPLPGANIVLSEKGSGTVSDNNGVYSLEVPQGGIGTIKVTFVGYKAQERTVQLRRNQNIDFRLEEEHLVTSEVVVSAIRAGSKTPVAYTNIGHAAIAEREAGSDIPYMLSLTPSAVTTSESGIGLGYTALRIRGTDPTRINITANGIPLNDSESQGVFWANMPNFAGSVEEIQIQRGVGTSTNGAAAFGATINMLTNNYKANPEATVSSAAGSFNTFINSVGVNTGLINNKFAFDARYSDLQTDGYVKRAFSDHHSLFLGAAMVGEKSLLRATIIHGKQQTGISWNGVTKEEMENDRRYNPAGQFTDENGNIKFYDNETDNYKQTHYQLAYSRTLSPLFNFNTTVHYTFGEGYYDSYKEDRKFSKYGWDNVIVNGQTIDRTDAIQQKWMRNHFYGSVISASYHPDNLNISVGAGWNRYDGDHFGEVVWMRYMGTHEKGDRWYKNNGDKKDFNVFAKANWQPAQKLNVMVDMQYRIINYDITGEDDDNRMMNISHSYNFFNPKAGLFFDIDDNNKAYTSLGISNREPTRTNFKDAKGDAKATPLPERLYDWELGYQYVSTVASAGINFFYMYYEDQLIPTGEKSEVGYDIMTNVKKSFRRGIELTGGVKFTSWLKWDANLTLSENKIDNFVLQGALLDQNWDETGTWIKKDLGTTDIAFSPNVVGASLISVSPFKQLKASISSKYVGKQYFDNTGSDERSIDSYFVNDLKFDYNFYPSKMRSATIQFSVNNIFDQKYISNAYGGVSFLDNGTSNPDQESWAYYYPQAGTTFMCKLTLNF
jgi:iron complex outermembrane receptor protein